MADETKAIDSSGDVERAIRSRDYEIARANRAEAERNAAIAVRDATTELLNRAEAEVERLRDALKEIARFEHTAQGRIATDALKVIR